VAHYLAPIDTHIQIWHPETCVTEAEPDLNCVQCLINQLPYTMRIYVQTFDYLGLYSVQRCLFVLPAVYRAQPLHLQDV
jgi:hypothetical protein